MSNGVNPRRSGNKRDTIMGTSANANRNSASSSSTAGPSTQQTPSSNDALPDGWEERTDPYGRLYYVDHRTKSSFIINWNQFNKYF